LGKLAAMRAYGTEVIGFDRYWRSARSSPHAAAQVRMKVVIEPNVAWALAALLFGRAPGREASGSASPSVAGTTAPARRLRRARSPG
jgi:hypothetical protein